MNFNGVDFPCFLEMYKGTKDKENVQCNKEIKNKLYYYVNV